MGAASLPLAAQRISPEQMKHGSVLLLLLQGSHRAQHVGEMAFWRRLPLLALCTRALKLGCCTSQLVGVAGSSACSILQQAQDISMTASFWDCRLPGRLLGHCQALRLPPPAGGSAQTCHSKLCAPPEGGELACLQRIVHRSDTATF